MSLIRWIKKSLFPLYLGMRVRLFHFYLKRKGKKEAIVLVPILPDGGSLKHYYHFIFDLILPLSFVSTTLRHGQHYYLKGPFGFSGILESFFGDDLIVYDVGMNGYIKKEVRFWGMNPVVMNKHFYSFEPLRKRVFNSLSISKSKVPFRILLIERGEDKNIVNSGKLRRSIKNHNEIFNTLVEEFPQEHVFNVRLEDLKFEDQVRLFYETKIVIAQHGAGLANVIWMQKGMKVLEFGFKNRRHFKKISEKSGLGYSIIPFQEEHIEVSKEQLTALMKALVKR